MTRNRMVRASYTPRIPFEQAGNGMTQPRSTIEPDIRTQCQKIIDTSVANHFGGYEAFAAMTARPDMPSIGPVMAEVFADSIQQGCRTLGAVTGDDLPEVGRFLPDERTGVARARQAVPGMTPQIMLQVRRKHRANARAVRELLDAYAARGPEQARTLYQQVADRGSAEALLMMLWGTAVTVQRQARTATTDRPTGWT